MVVTKLACIIVGCLVFSAGAAPCGAVLYRDSSSKHYSYYSVPDNAAHHYFGFLEGPAWENMYCGFRIYADADDRNILDIIGKYKPGPVLQYFDDPKVDEHENWPWGTDIFRAGSTLGFGSFRLLLNNQWLNPQIGKSHKNLDSMIIRILDSSTATPKAAITYHGWNIGTPNKVTVTWTVSTALNSRITHCEVAIDGDYAGTVVVGIKKNTGVTLIQKPEKALLATIGKQGGINEGFTDTLLLAVCAETKYFSAFQDNTLNYGMVLTPDAKKKAVWSLAFSWAKETDPVFHNSNWENTLFATTGVVGGHTGDFRVSKPWNTASSGERYSLAGKKLNANASSAKRHAGVFLVRANGMALKRVLVSGECVTREYRH